MLNEQLKSHLLNLYNMVLADDTVKPEELVKLYQIAKRHGIGEDEFNTILMSPSQFVMPDDLEGKIRCLYELVEIILADGEVANNEMIVLKRFCTRFGFNESNVDAIADYLIESVRQEKSIPQILNEINA